MVNTTIFYEFNGNKRNIYLEDLNCNKDLYRVISKKENLDEDLFKILLNGKPLAADETIAFNNEAHDLFLQISIPLLGGKGGFGSMLRAIGAQIEKTTNKEACRDLSGRRLRDVNAEKRIKNWIRRKAELQKEEERKKREKLERLTQEPKIEFEDDDYLKEKDLIPLKVEEAMGYAFKIKNKKLKNLFKSKSKKVASSVASNCSTESNSLESSSKLPVSTLTKTDDVVEKNDSDLKKSPEYESSSPASGSTDIIDEGNQLSGTTSNHTQNDSKKIDKTSTSNKRSMNDQPVIISKKKKVELWLGDDLESDDTDED